MNKILGSFQNYALRQQHSSALADSAVSPALTKNLLSSIQVIHLLGRRITLATVDTIIDCIQLSIRENRRIVVANFNVYSFNLSLQLPWFYEFLQKSEIAHCDGFGILKALNILGIKTKKEYRVSYTKLLPDLLKLCDQNGYSVFLLGATEENLKSAIGNLSAEYKGARFAGHTGYFDVDNLGENCRIIKKINEAKPDILLLGMGMPRQENWILRHKDYLHTHAILPGGAAIDRLAGVVEDCPDYVSDLGLEWLYRLLREPKRLASRYLLGNPAFLLQIIFAKSNQSQRDLSQQPEENAIQDFGLVVSGFLEPNECVMSSNTEMNVRSLENGEPNDGSFLGSKLVAAGLLSQSDIDQALAEQRLTGMRLGDVLIRNGVIDKESIESLVRNA